MRIDPDLKKLAAHGGPDKLFGKFSWDIPI